MKMPIFRTTMAVSVRNNHGKNFELPGKAFVQVMSLRNLPPGFHRNWPSFDSDREDICYCAFGYVVIEKALIEVL